MCQAYPIGELAGWAESSRQRASREVARLADHGVVVRRTLGRNRLVTASWDAKKPEPFIAQIKSQLLVPVRLDRR